MVIDNMEFRSYDDNYYISEYGDVFSLYCRRYVKHYIDHDGYHRVDIHGKHVKIHKLVYLTWVGDIPPGLNVRHYDDNKDNNHVSNLVLGTQRENIEDSFRNGHKHLTGNTHHLILYDKKTNDVLVFCPAERFIDYCGHSCVNGSLSRIFTRQWFKNRYEIIKYDLGKV